jgi:hypothetical protein
MASDKYLLKFSFKSTTLTLLAGCVILAGATYANEDDSPCQEMRRRFI